MNVKQQLEQLEKDLAEVVNKHGLDNLVGMPDHVIAEFIVTSVSALKKAHKKNEAEK